MDSWRKKQKDDGIVIRNGVVEETEHQFNFDMTAGHSMYLFLDSRKIYWI
jgi:hypothetical protein